MKTMTAREALYKMARIAFENGLIDIETIKNDMRIRCNEKNRRAFYRLQNVLLGNKCLRDG